MKRERQLPECFGEQGVVMLHGESPQACIPCPVFEKCHKITVAGTLQAIATDLDLIVQNGLRKGTLEGFDMLEDAPPDTNDQVTSPEGTPSADA
jgi:hypothetical protein